MKTFLLILTWFSFFFLNIDSVLAKSETFALETTAFNLQTSNTKPLTEIVTVKNLTNEILSLQLRWKPYNISQHAIDFASPSLTSMQVQPQGIGNVEVLFQNPDNLRPGDYYGNLELTAGHESEEVEFQLRFLGQLKETIELREFNFSDQKLTLGYTNTGNITSSVKTTLVITNFFGKKVLSHNTSQFNIKAQSINHIDLAANLKIPGPYQAKIETSFGPKGITQTDIRSLWVSPFLFWVVVSFLPILLIVSGYLYFKKKINV